MPHPIYLQSQSAVWFLFYSTTLHPNVLQTNPPLPTDGKLFRAQVPVSPPLPHSELICAISLTVSYLHTILFHYKSVFIMIQLTLRF